MPTEPRPLNPDDQTRGEPLRMVPKEISVSSTAEVATLGIEAEDDGG